jgi:uncharacterized protein YyaL (SSP411 family)
MIAALAQAGIVLKEPQYIKIAEKAFGFILHHLRNPDGRLLHRFRDHEAAIHGLLNDYAFLAWGALELYEATFVPDYLDIALRLTDEMLDHFWDNTHNGFFLAADDPKDLVVRTKDLYDGAIPSGNSVAAMNLLRIHRMTAKTHFEEKAIQAIRSVAGIVRKAPFGYTQLLLAVDFAIGPSQEVVITGDSNTHDTQKMIEAVQSKYLPNTVVVFRPAEEKKPSIVHLAKYTESYKPLNSHATAYVCENFNCKPPTDKVDQMLELLETSSEGK